MNREKLRNIERYRRDKENRSEGEEANKRERERGGLKQ